jgi:hypothetical protein
MEGASMMFHGDYKKRCLLTILVSQILLLTQLISEIKNLLLQYGLFSTIIRYFLKHKTLNIGLMIFANQHFIIPGLNVIKLFMSVIYEFSE